VPGRTSVRFLHDGEIWSVVEKWASASGFRIKEKARCERLYQKGSGIFGPPVMLKIRQDAQETVLEAWIRVNGFMRVLSLFIFPSEIGIESGGYLLWSDRRAARKAVNGLLSQLGQEPIP